METALTLVAELDPIQAKIVEFHINGDTIDEAAEFRAELKKFRKRVEAAETTTAKPLKDAWEAAREPFLALRKKIDETEKLLDGRITAWNVAENERRRIADQKERARQLEALKLAQAEAEKNADVETVIALEVAQTHIEDKPQENKLKSINTGKAKLSFRDNWVAVIEDESRVPDEYWIIDTSKLDGFAKRTKGTQQIPGVRIENRPTPVNR